MTWRTVRLNAAISLSLLVPMIAALVGWGPFEDDSTFGVISQLLFGTAGLLFLFGVLIPICVTHAWNTAPNEARASARYAGLRMLVRLFRIVDDLERPQ